MKLLLLLSLVFFIGCTGDNAAVKAKRSADTPRLQYLERVRKLQSEHTFPKSESESVWGRAQTWITRYSTMKIQTVSDYVIETFNVTPATNGDLWAGAIPFAYSVTREPSTDGVKITVKCRTDIRAAPDYIREVSDNERMLVDYLITGRVDYPELIAQ